MAALSAAFWHKKFLNTAQYLLELGSGHTRHHLLQQSDTVSRQTIVTKALKVVALSLVATLKIVVFPSTYAGIFTLWFPTNP